MASLHRPCVVLPQEGAGPADDRVPQVRCSGIVRANVRVVLPKCEKAKLCVAAFVGSRGVT